MTAHKIYHIKSFMEASQENMVSKILCTIRLKRRLSISDDKDSIPWVIGVTRKSINLIDQIDIDDKATTRNDSLPDLSEVLNSMSLLSLARATGALQQIDRHRHIRIEK